MKIELLPLRLVPIDVQQKGDSYLLTSAKSGKKNSLKLDASTYQIFSLFQAGASIADSVETFLKNGWIYS